MIKEEINFIWLGSTLPKSKFDCIDTWQKLYGQFNVHLWTEDNKIQDVLVRAGGYALAERYNATDCYVAKSDILRLAIIYVHGGIYSDCDNVIYRKFDNLLLDQPIFAFYENDVVNVGTIANAVFGAVEKSKVLEMLIHLLNSIPVEAFKTLTVDNAWIVTGPMLWTYAYRRYRLRKLTIFPSKLMYPNVFYDYNVNRTPYYGSELENKHKYAYYEDINTYVVKFDFEKPFWDSCDQLINLLNNAGN